MADTEAPDGTSAFPLSPMNVPAAVPAAVPRPFRLSDVVRLLRPHQWAKNGLALLPAALAHRITEPSIAADALLAVAALSLCASGTYIVNDWLDRARDRAHPTKRMRPLASGAVSPVTGFVLAVALVGGAFALAAAALPRAFVAVLATYTVATLAYSGALKRIAVLDVLVLAGLYALRLVAGAAATGVPVSAWLLAFSLFFFLALALLKRYVELRQMETGAAPADNGRGYHPDDAAIVRGMGPATGMLAVLVFALYTSGPDVAEMYARPDLLWLATPALVYWTLRMWLLAHRGQVHDDPVLFAVKDPASYAVVAVVAAVLWAAT